MPPKNLWKSSDTLIWNKYLSAYDNALKFLSEKKKKAKLISLDNWYQKTLGKNVRSRDIPYLEKAELVKLMEWKLTRGKFRPRLAEFIQSNTEENIKKITETSFKQIEQVDVAIKELCQLKGVGPATASAILTVYKPGMYCFMADEAVVSVLSGKIDYTLKYYHQFLEKVRDKATELSKKDENNCWTPHIVECALWSWHLISKHDIPFPDSSKAEKRKSGESDDISLKSKKQKT